MSDLPSFRHDAEVHAVYIGLRPGKVSYSEELDLIGPRVVDYAEDGTRLGVEFLNVHRGVWLEDVPEAETVRRILEEHGIAVVPSPKLGERAKPPA